MLVMKNLNFTNIILGALAVLTATVLLSSCDKDTFYPEGDYLYENRDLTYLENFSGILVHWDEAVTEEQQEAIREIAASMVTVEGGTFQMGADDSLAASDEQPVHTVTLSNYRIAKFTVTRSQWQAIMGNAPQENANFGTGDDLPATYVNYSDCAIFIEKLNSLSDLKFRLPTEAEWEYAARGGKHSQGYSYSGGDNPDEVAWHQGNAGNVLHAPGCLRSNELGLYDMSGNIWEWCSDRYGEYPTTAQTNPTGPENGNKYVVRGGSFSYEAPFSRVSQRNRLYGDTRSFVTGLRLAIDEK